jgi:hypothetical protein
VHSLGYSRKRTTGSSMSSRYFFRRKGLVPRFHSYRKKPSGPQPKAYEFSRKQKLPATRQRFCRSLELTPLSLKTRYRTQWSGKSDTAHYKRGSTFCHSFTAQHGWIGSHQDGLAEKQATPSLHAWQWSAR